MFHIQSTGILIMATTLQVQKQFSVNGLAEEAKIYQKNICYQNVLKACFHLKVSLKPI